MATLRQILANQRNAQKSTGPVSDDGKAVVARNALKHGVFCEDLLAEGEDPAELDAFRNAFLADIAPLGASQCILAERIISASWRLKRLSRAEVLAHASLADDQREDLAENGHYPGEEEDQTAHDKIRRERDIAKSYEAMEAKRRAWADEQLCPAGLTLAIDLAEDKSEIERYSRYEKRLEGTIHRAWRELRLLRKDAERQPPSPLVGEGGGEGEAVRTPESECSRAKSATSPPHPDPLPQGEREEMQNKPNSPAIVDQAEVYAQAPAQPLPQPLPRVVLRPLPGQLKSAGDDAIT
jgi:hypothetical protein